MIAHLARCAKLTWPDRYACDCGADAQNDLATKLDQAESTQKADTIDRRWGVDPESERRLDAMLRETQPATVPSPLPPVRVDTPLRAVARMLDRLHARATHHDSPRHLLAMAYAAAELAATLSPADAIRVLDGVEPEPAANEPTHSEKPDTPKSP